MKTSACPPEHQPDARAASAVTLDLDGYLALDGRAPDASIAYGSAPSQYAELFLPTGAGPFPLVVLVHGGCWRAVYRGMRQMRAAAGALAAAGIAVWNVEYRRVDEEGGGYPGTYLDLIDALDKLIAIAPAYRLDLHRLAAVGHSAGGHLVQWLAGRARIMPSSPLYRPEVLPVRAVVSLGGLADIEHEAARIARCCGCDVAQLAGRPDSARPDVFADTCAARLTPNGSRTILVTGQCDTVSPPRVAHDYARRVRRVGDRADVLILPGASHYDEIAPGSPCWPLVLAAIRQLLNIAKPTGQATLTLW